MASFVTLAEYETFTGVDVPATEATAVLAQLDAACDTVRDYVCQTLDVVAGDVVNLHGSGTRALSLPELPVTSVASVTLDGEAVTDYTLDAYYGLLWRDDPGWWMRGDLYVVTYTHGYATVPNIYKRVAAVLARGASSVSPGVRQESTGPFSVTYDDVDERSVLAALDRKVVRRMSVA